MYDSKNRSVYNNYQNSLTRVVDELNLKNYKNINGMLIGIQSTRTLSAKNIVLDIKTILRDLQNKLSELHGMRIDDLNEGLSAGAGSKLQRLML